MKSIKVHTNCLCERAEMRDENKITNGRFEEKLSGAYY